MNLQLSPAEMSALQTLWNALRRNDSLVPADCIVGFGNYNTDIARRTAELYHQGLAPWVLFTGGAGRNTLGMLRQSEAELFASVAIAEGVPEGRILLDTTATNTSENLTHTREIISRAGIPQRKILGVHQPFMEQRIVAAAKVTWPELKLLVTSPQLDIPTFFAHAERDGVTARAVVEELVGDFQRMELYAARGWQAPVEFPEEAKEAFRLLTASGFTGQLAAT